MAQTHVYIDLTKLCEAPSYLTGIQRVVREIVLRMLKNPALECTLLSETLCTNGGGYKILSSDSLAAYFTGHEGSPYDNASPRVITLREIPTGAVFFDIDAAWSVRSQRLQIFPILKSRGVTIVSFLYDIIPITEPQYFHGGTAVNFISWITAVLQYADCIICNSEATKVALNTLCDTLEMQSPACTVVPLGADFIQKAAAAEKTDTTLLAKLPQYRYLLMVGTIEPRKNHALLLDAVEPLSALGIKVVFAGRIGWNVDEFVEQMAAHPQNGTDFFFVKGPTDATIHELYKNALAVVFPTKNEGFGLPIVEALLHGTPVLASDIPVLREVGGAFADYFDNTSVDSLVDAVKMLLADSDAYRQKRAAITAYRPRTWDAAAQDIMDVLLESGAIEGNMPADSKVSQMVVLTARNDDLLRTLPYLDACLPFIERMLVCCPQRNVAELESKWNGRIKLSFYTDEELLGGETLPDDHSTRNFFLRCLLMRKAPLDDVFIMTDDDYRPLLPLTQEFFLKNRRCQAYYCYDLREWKGTQGNYTSYDLCMFHTRDFLSAEHLPTLQYSSHQPQIIDRTLYLEMLDRYPDIVRKGLDEWSTYFNYCIANHPDKFSAQVYCAIGWPGAITDWTLWCHPSQLCFENFYDALYDENRVFAGLSKTYQAEGFCAESMEKVRRWTKELDRQATAYARYDMYAAMHQSEYQLPPQFLLRETANGAEWTLPKILFLPADTLIRIPLHVDTVLRTENNAVVRYCIQDENRRYAVPLKTIAMSVLYADEQPELVIPVPAKVFKGVLRLEYDKMTEGSAPVDRTVPIVICQ